MPIRAAHIRGAWNIEAEPEVETTTGWRAWLGINPLSQKFKISLRSSPERVCAITVHTGNRNELCAIRTTLDRLSDLQNIQRHRLPVKQWLGFDEETDELRDTLKRMRVNLDDWLFT